MFTDQPGLQVYSGNFFDGGNAGPSGRPYERRPGIALETQGFPDAPNRSGQDWPSVRVDPGRRYDTTTAVHDAGLDGNESVTTTGAASGTTGEIAAFEGRGSARCSPTRRRRTGEWRHR